MTPSRRARGTLGLGLGLSLAVHAGLGVVAARTSLPGAPPSPPGDGGLVELLTLPPDEPDLRLGIEQSSADTPAWLGFADATPHTASLSEVEQSALSPDPAGAPAVAVVVAQGQREPAPEEQAAPVATAPPADAAPPSDDTPPPEAPTEQPDGAESATQPAASQPEAMPERTTPEQAAPADVSPIQQPVDRPAPVEDAAPAPAAPADDAATVDIAADLLLAQVAVQTPAPTLDPLALLADPQPESEASDHEVPTAEETRAQGASPTGTVANDPAPDAADAADEPTKPLDAEEKPAAAPSPDDQPAPQGDERPIVAARSGNEGETPGEQSPSESSAASTQESIEVRPGRVVAAEGLEITTVRPQFAVSTMATARPRSPTILIEFSKDGKVRRARFITGQTTGYADVDQPLLAAVYRWTASGEPLSALSDDPEDVIMVRMRIILR